MTNHKSIQIGQDFYCYIWTGKGNNCNTSLLCHALQGEQPNIVVDPGHINNEWGEACFDSLTQSMAGDGFKIEDVGLVICTHCHPDHFESVESVVKRSNAQVALSREEYEFYNNDGNHFYTAFGSNAPQVEPSFYLEEGDLKLDTANKLAVRVLFTPGHTPGSISLYLEELKILISGDVIFAGSIGRTDFPGGNTSLLLESIDRLSQLDVEYLIPGHSTQAGNIISNKNQVSRNFHLVKTITRAR